MPTVFADLFIVMLFNIEALLPPIVEFAEPLKIIVPLVCVKVPLFVIPISLSSVVPEPSTTVVPLEIVTCEKAEELRRRMSRSKFSIIFLFIVFIFFSVKN